MAAVPKVNLTIPQGETFKARFNWVDENGVAIDNTAYTASRMQIRQAFTSVSTEASLTVGSGITLGGANGVIDIEISEAVTEAWTFTEGVYDLEMVIPGSPDDVTRAVQGKVCVTPEVTKP